MSAAQAFSGMGYLAHGRVAQIANVGANLAERTASEIATAKDKEEGKDGDGRNFVPEVIFTIKSPTTESTVLLRSLGPMTNYLMTSRQFTADAMQDFFEPAPAN
ncbi:MAG: hypothetical protein RBS36_00480 [Thiomicrospira sp.]|nr:hypothetical protein [Thiomicrospira sp.]